MKRKKMKPVRAWALCDNANIHPWALASRDAVIHELAGDLAEDERVIRVEIREAPKRRKAVRK